jgi:OOP family OmpA-OmpF porin
VLAGLVVVATGVAVVVVGWVGGDDASAAPCRPSDIPAHDESTLVVEGDGWSGYAPFRDEALLEGTGYQLLYVDQPCQEMRAADLTAGRADMAVTTLDQYLLRHPEGTLVGVIDQTVGADAMALGTVNHPELDTIDDIRTLVEQYEEEGDKPVLAYTGDSPSEMLLNELANTFDELRLSDFELVSVDQSATAYEMLERDEAQIAVIWEPETSRARAAGYEIVLSSADVPDAIVDVILASDRLIQRDAAAVQALVSSYYARMDSLLADPEALTRFYAEDGGLDPAEAESLMVDGVRLYSSREADEFMNQALFPLDTPQVEQSVDSIGSLLALLHPNIPLDRATVDGRYVRSMVAGGPS